ncbi:putative ABC transport system permease protein [Peptoclostridium litorale DSM 5388]|uniref:ABC-type transport system, sugar-family permease n=1 Tax=Peptoclostridium litorale DSM 5388 TaxID=1121324 RepID=A0A069RBW9_PEPLI|nr:ABC transporter [Peptoclostridium litorale]KDR94536.1 ABC-type transport system, sugar-family permease [Peptoclostridium litorale DSM 5388]SIO37157.1 putative ABC transport system permease protein [Peptoclostridium litorale DSM 5388]
MEALNAVLIQSLILSVMVLGVYISYEILDFPDLSADGSFATGAAFAVVGLKVGMNPAVCILMSVLAGALAGLVTGVLHVKVRISSLLSGILVMGILYSVNLRIMGRANIPLFNTDHMFKGGVPAIVIAAAFLTVIKLSIDGFMNTGLGYSIKAVGDNEQMVKSLGIETGRIKILALMISNALVSLSGCIMAQYQGFSDVSMGMGMLVLGIASIIIGKALAGRLAKRDATICVIVGTVFYQFTIYAAINMGMAPTDLKMITSFVVVIFLAAGRSDFGEIIKKHLRRRSYAKSTAAVKELS